MDKASLSRSSSTSSFEQVQEEKNNPEKTVPITQFISMRIKLPMNTGPKKSEETRSAANPLVKPDVKNEKITYSEPVISPRSPRTSSLTMRTSDVRAAATTTNTIKNMPAPVSTTENANNKSQKNSPTDIARSLIRAETAVNDMPYKKEMNAAAVDRFLRGKVEENGVNLIETRLMPFVDRHLGGSELGNIFRELDKRFLAVRPQIDALKNTILAELEDPILYTDALLQSDQRFINILDEVIKPLMDYVKGDDTVEGSKLPAPFLQLLKSVDNEILEWHASLSQEAAQTGSPAPAIASLATVRKNAMVALIAIRSLSVMLNKSHGSQVGGEFVLLENHLVKTINRKLIDFVNNLISCPNDKFEILMKEKRTGQITNKAQARSGRAYEVAEKSPEVPRQKRSGSFSSMLEQSSMNKLETKGQADSVAEHNQVLISLFVKKYGLNKIDADFSLIFQKRMSRFIDSGEVNLSEKAAKKECLKLLTDHMLELKRNDRPLKPEMEALFQSLSGHAFAEILDEEEAKKTLSPRSRTLKKQ